MYVSLNVVLQRYWTTPWCREPHSFWDTLLCSTRRVNWSFWFMLFSFCDQKGLWHYQRSLGVGQEISLLVSFTKFLTFVISKRLPTDTSIRYTNYSFVLFVSWHFVWFISKIFSNRSSFDDLSARLRTLDGKRIGERFGGSLSTVAGSKGSLNDPAPSVSLGQDTEPHKSSSKISLKEEEKKGWVLIRLSTDMILKPRTQS